MPSQILKLEELHRLILLFSYCVQRVQSELSVSVVNEQAATTHQSFESNEERKQRERIEKVERERVEAHRLLDGELDAKAKMEEMKRLSAYGYGDKNGMAG